MILNSLEDADNPYRAIFEVKKLDEGWDVLNLFDIVRLYETRQSSGKRISQATVSEAQLIGRGARYYPFQLSDEQPRFQRKYDSDVDNPLRVCETLFYHCQTDHRYVTELNQALKQIGLDPEELTQCHYTLKPSFKKDEIYTTGRLFLNRREECSREEVTELEPHIRDASYKFNEKTGVSKEDSIMEDTFHADVVEASNLKTVQMTVAEIAAVNYNIVHSALRKYPAYKFNSLKSHYPQITSMREFIMSDKYLGRVSISIRSDSESLSARTMYDAIFYVAGKIAASISNIQSTYRGTKEFFEEPLSKIFKDKTVNYTEVHEGGLGYSQNHPSVKAEWKLDLSNEDWFAYSDNFGTSEEKVFVAYFHDHLEELRKSYDKVYLVRNEREFHIYSFDNGDRFEPDYVIFLQKKNADGYEQIQVFVEPKGNHLLEQDEWKEKFLLQIQQEAIPVKQFVDDNKYKIWGIHFFNSEFRMTEMKADFDEMMNLGSPNDNE